jgi:hypothetical protein
MKRLLFVFFLTFSIAGLNSCSKQETKSEVAEGSAISESAAASASPTTKLPDPSGTYSDSNGGLSFSFYAGGRFSQSLLGETSFGTWSRAGNDVDLTYEDGSSVTIQNGDGYIIFNGARLSK